MRQAKKSSSSDKDFNVATNSPCCDKDQRRKYVATSSEFFVTQNSVLAIQGNKTMSRQRKGLSQQQQHTTVRNLSRRKKILLRQRLKKTTKRMSQHIKEYYNKVEELEAKNSVVTKENYVATKDGKKRIEDSHDMV